MHCNLRPPDVTPSVVLVFFANFALRVRTMNGQTDQNSGIAIRFSDPDFLKQSRYFAIRPRFHAVTLTHRVSRVQTMYQI